MKTFATAGVSRKDGKLALRASNRDGDTYSVILKKEGHTDVHLVKLSHPMSKEEIRKYLPRYKHFQDPEILALLKGEGDEGEAETSKAAKKAVAKPKQDKAPKKAAAKKKTTRTKKDNKKSEEAPADDGSEVATAETSHDDHVDAAAELGHTAPAFAKHLSE